MLSYRNGSQFVIPGDIMGRMGLPITEFVNLTGDFLQEFVFATATSANHYNQSIDAIASVQKYFPGRKIYCYDLGLDANQRNEVGDESIHYSDAIMGVMASLAFVLGIHQWPVNSPHKWPVTRKMFPFDDVIMHSEYNKSLGQRRYIKYTKNSTLSTFCGHTLWN